MKLHCYCGFSFPVRSIISMTNKESKQMHTLLHTVILNYAYEWLLKLIKTEWQVSANGIKLGSGDCICACMDKNPNTPPSKHAAAEDANKLRKLRLCSLD